MSISPLSVGEDKLTKAVNLSREEQVGFRCLIVREWAGTEELNLFQIRLLGRLLSRESTIFGSLGGWQK
jgi:hypothetical protein